MHSNYSHKRKNEQGIVAITLVFSLVFIAMILSLSSVVVFANRLQATQNFGNSEQSYYAAESGLEDAILRLLDAGKTDPSSSYTLLVGSSSTLVTVSAPIGGSRTIVSQGDERNRIRTLGVVLTNNTTGASFTYGAQVGDGGITMSNGSSILGSVYSNGSIIGANNAEVTGDAFVAGNGNTIEDIEVGGDAHAYSLEDCTVVGDIVYVTGGGVERCTAGGTTTEQAEEIPTIGMPLGVETIDGWKADATAGGIISVGDFAPPKDSTRTIGPGIIGGDLILINNQTIIISGTVWVQGNIDINNGTSISLASSYGADSGVVVTDGWIHTKNNGQFAGSGTEGSYIMLLTTSTCRGSSGSNCTHHTAAVDLHNNAEGAIFYASEGLVNLHNNVSVTQINGWAISLDNNAVLEYAIGLADLDFSSGPSGGKSLQDWQEQ